MQLSQLEWSCKSDPEAFSDGHEIPATKSRKYLRVTITCNAVVHADVSSHTLYSCAYLETEAFQVAAYSVHI